MIDIAIAVPVLLIVSPLLLVAAIAIRLSSPGPAIFSQQRVGRERVPFLCHKLRTMDIATPALPTHEVSVSSITPVGKILRRFKIDEFPQLWNVLKGEMTLVGPRPCLPSQTALIEHRMLRDVFSLTPGMTGLAQVKGIDMSNPALCAEKDAVYLRNKSTYLDLSILAATFVGVRLLGNYNYI